MDTIKLSIIKNEAEKGQLETIVKVFIESCIDLNPEKLEPLIEDDKLFDDKDKYRFLGFLKAQFDSARKIGLNKTIVKQGRCEMCIRGHKSYEFYGNESKPRFAYVIEKENGQVKNIFNCNSSSGWFTNT